MTRVIASLLFVGLIVTAGCKKDAPKENSEASKPADSSIPAMRPKLSTQGTSNAPPECKKLCMVIGKCTLRDGKCYATSSPDCRAAFACKAGGLCEAKDGSCIAANDADCEKSDFCATQGKCLAVNGRCENKNSMPADSAKPAESAKPANSGK